MCSGTAALLLSSRSCRRRAGWWVALPPVLGFACILHSCSGLTSNCSSLPASPRRKGFPRVRDLVPSRGRSPSKSNETVISRSIWAKLIKGKAKESVCYRHCPCGSGRRSVERRQKACPWSARFVSQSHGHNSHQESNQRNARSDLRNGFRALPVQPTDRGDRCSGPAAVLPVSGAIVEIESSTALQDE